MSGSNSNTNNSNKRQSLHPHLQVSEVASTVREEHRKEVYAIAWSQDILVEKKKGKTLYYRTFGSCAGPYATVYKVQVFNLQGESFLGPTSGPLQVHQSYQDAHPCEEFYACAFGGRSFLPTTKKKKKKKNKRKQNNQQKKQQQQQPPKKRKEQGSMVEFEEEADDDFLLLSGTTGGGAKDDHDNDDNDITMEDDIDDDDNDNNNEPLEIHLDQDPTGPELLCVAGKNRTIQVIDTTTRQLWMSLAGHGDEITNLSFHPLDGNILASTSNDKSCRLWNVRNGTNIAILAGHDGHLDIVMSVAWHPTGEKLITGGHDNLVKIWNLEEGTDIAKAMQESYKVELTRVETTTNTTTTRSATARRQSSDDDSYTGDDDDSSRSRRQRTTSTNQHQLVEAKDYFKPVILQFPIHSTHKVHYQPVDCVSFVVAPMVLTKASNKIELWYPDYVNHENPAVIHPAPSNLEGPFKTFDIIGITYDVMFYRFGTCPQGKLMAVGNALGHVLLFEIDSKHNRHVKKLDCFPKITTTTGSSSNTSSSSKPSPSSARTVRMTAFSPDGRILLACCDDGTIAKWDIQNSNNTIQQQQKQGV